MIEFTAHDFDELCRVGAVRAEMATIERHRRIALRRFWLVLLVTVAIVALTISLLVRWNFPIWGIILAGIALVVGLLAAWAPISIASHNLKLPVLDALAGRAGLEYCATGFDPPVFPLAGRDLFGDVASYSFTDLFHGKDEADSKFAFYEGTVTRSMGRGTGFVFRGMFYAFQRPTHGTGETLILPHPGPFNLADPYPRERVTFEGDADFARVFDVQSTRPDDVAALVGPELRRTLTVMSQKGRVWVWIGARDVLVAVQDHDRFEPGSLFRAQPGEARVRGMFDDVCAAMGTLRTLIAAVDRGR